MRWSVAFALLAAAACAQAGELRNVRLVQGPEATRVVLEFDAPVQESVFALANPDRLVIDLAHARRAAGLKLDGAAGVVKSVRSGPHDGGLRVVLDLKARTVARQFSLGAGGGYGYRMILDLAGDTAAALPAAAGGGMPAADAPGAPDDAPVRPAPAPGQVTAQQTQPAVAAPAPAPLAVPAVVAVSAPPPAAAEAPAAPAAAPAPPPISVPTEAPAPVADSAAVTAAATAQDTPRQAAKTFIVAVDAGHGGDDPGARGVNGLFEKDVTLAIARRLARRIDQQPGMRAVLTRDGDYYVGLRERTIKARDAQADLFVSIHANAYRDHLMNGTAVYVLSDHGATTEQARWIANHENAADLVGGVDLHDKDDKLAAVLIDISQSATMAASFDLGNRMLESLGRVNSLQKPQVQQAGFMVLKSPDIPSVLVETAFISNPREERLLRDPGSQERFAGSIFDGIRGYFSRYRPMQQVVTADAGAARRAVPGRTIPVRLLRSQGSN